jgi:sulfur carrier protein ThiS adenylyltransferase
MKISEIESHLKNFRVGIAGAGGLGSNCAAALVRCGVGTLVIADYDIVEKSNLSRQYYFADQTGMPKTAAMKQNLVRMRPGVNIETWQGMLDSDNIPGIFSGCDVIVEAFDKAEMKEMLIETISRELPATPVVMASGLAGWGKNELIGCRKIDDLLYVCGDEISETGEDMPPLAPRVGIVANMQANIVIEILMKKSNG